MQTALCFGPLLWFDVPGDDDHHPVALVECVRCGEAFIATNPMDALHRDARLVRVVED